MKGKCVDCLCWWHIECALLGRRFSFLCRLEQINKSFSDHFWVHVC
jgi:hypothetical protein